MERLARKLANNIANSLGYDDEKERVVAYGLTALIQIAVTVLLVLSLGLLIGAAPEALIICFSVSILRKYSGGAHAGSIELCTVIAVLYSVGFAAASRYLLLPLLGIYPMAGAIFIVYLFAYSTVCRRAPVDSPNKPITTESKKMRMRKGALLVLTVYLGLSLALLAAGMRYPFFHSYGAGLLFGILWQISTLTKLGFHLFDKIDFVSNKV